MAEIYGNENNNILFGTGGEDTITGFGGNDVLYGFTGADTLIGGSGSDIFVLGIGQGQDTITDFQLGEDSIGLSGSLKFEDLTLIQDGDNTLITVANSGEQLAFLTGINAGQLNSDNFKTINFSS